jgi:hypothetical protein
VVLVTPRKVICDNQIAQPSEYHQNHASVHCNSVSLIIKPAAQDCQWGCDKLDTHYWIQP